MSTCSPIYSKCNARMKIRMIVIQKIVQQFMAEQKNAHIHSHTFLYQFSLITIFFLLFNVRDSQSQAKSSHAICINLLMLFFVVAVADTSSFFLKFLSFVERLILLKLIENHFTFHIVRSSFSICFISSCRLSEYEYLSLCFFSVLLADFVNCARIYRCSLS